MGEITEKITRKNQSLESLLPLTISAQHGLIDQNSFFNKQIASKDVSGYYLIKNGEFAYNKSYSNAYPWGAIKRLDLHDKGVLSTLYIVFKPTNVESNFLVSYYSADNWHKEVSIRAAEGARNHGLLNISPQDFFETKLLIPNKYEEQTKIGSFFRSLDRLITLHQRKLDRMKELKKAFLDLIFSQKLRFEGFTDSWELRKLGEVVTRVQGNDGRMNLPTLTISASSGWLDQRDRFSSNIAGNEQKNYTLLKKGELSYNHGNSKLAKYGTVFVLRNSQEALVPKVYHSFKTTLLSDADFIEYMFSTKNPDRELAKLISSGARMDGLLNISYDDFIGIKISLPYKVEQQKIALFFRSIDNLIAIRQEKINQLTKLKTTFLKNMFI